MNADDNEDDMKRRHRIGHFIHKSIVNIIKQVFNMIQLKLCTLV